MGKLSVTMQSAAEHYHGRMKMFDASLCECIPTSAYVQDYRALTKWLLPRLSSAHCLFLIDLGIGFSSKWCSGEIQVSLV